jgi:mycoredoxin
LLLDAEVLFVTRSESTLMPEQIILYGRPGCFMVGAAKRTLERANATFEYINIHRNEAARKRVREINNGNESVPTLEFPDETVLTEPSTDELKQKLEEMGYSVAASKTKNHGGGILVLSVAGIIMVVVGIIVDEVALIGVGVCFLLLPVLLQIVRLWV